MPRWQQWSAGQRLQWLHGERSGRWGVMLTDNDCWQVENGRLPARRSTRCGLLVVRLSRLLLLEPHPICPVAWAVNAQNRYGRPSVRSAVTAPRAGAHLPYFGRFF